MFSRLAAKLTAALSPIEGYRSILDGVNRVRNAWSAEADSRLRERRPGTLEERIALAALACERTLGMRPFDVQILGALAMYDGRIAEMQTGEGKTLAAVLSVYAMACDGHRVQVWTANDYLARRDAVWMGPAYEWLGLEVAHVEQGTSRESRRRAWKAGVTYSTANEAGFDFLRDQLALEPEELVHSPFDSVLIDEADSILIDEARIPLVIAGEAAAPEGLALLMARLTAGFRRGLDFFTDEYGRNVQLTDVGASKVEAAFDCGNLYEPRNYRLFTGAQDALHAQFLLRRDVDYIVRNERIELVDEFKGRVAQDRRWPAGLQTALEAKERLPLRKQGRILGSITLQNLVRLYRRTCGMTGTAATQAVEFAQVYGLDVVTIPTNKPVIRIDHADVVYDDRLSKERAVVAEIARVHATGRPVLVGTASIEESERLSERVRQAGVAHEVLNARNNEAEARIIARAGERGAVTISTNMAGRGTDIPLSGGETRQLGGLYVIGTNKHESRRIDNQLRGRAGRQGDPGESRFLVSLDDDLLAKYGIREILRDPAVDIRRAVDHVQRVVEGQTLEMRRTLWKYDGLIEEHRRKLAETRRAILFRDDAEMTEVERRVRLLKIDDIWSDYLAAIAELKGGIHWVSWSGKDPLHTFLTGAGEIFDEALERIEAEVAAAIDEGGEVPDSFERGATWTYLTSDQPFGTLQERWVKAIRQQVYDLLH